MSSETLDVIRRGRRRRKVLPGDRGAAADSAREAAESIRIHDLKNLAGRLTLLLQNLADHYDDPLFKNIALEVLGDTVGRMNQMVSQYRRHPSQVIVKLTLNLNDLLAGLAGDIPLETFPGVEVIEDYGQILPIWGDDYYLRSALLSILVNALEAMPSGGTLSLRTRTIRRDGQDRVLVEIEDTGIGMSRSFIRTRLYSPFATTKPHGLGLGLYNARQVIDLHGGTVHVNSAPSRGTLFRIAFDAADEEAS